MHIKVLGPGCNNCKVLFSIAREAVAALRIDATIDKVEDFPSIVAYGVLRTPALVINEQLVIAGRVPTPEHMRELITAAQHGAS